MDNRIASKTWVWVTLSIAIVLIIVLAVFTILPAKTNPQAAGLSKPNLAVFELYASAPIVAADQPSGIINGKSCFAKAGIAPTIIKLSKGPEIVDALVGGSADFGTLAITPIAFQALQGTDLVIFATIQTTDHDIKVLGHKSAGIDSGATLKGKRVGFVGGTFGEIFLDKYLNKYYLTRTDLNLTSGAPAQLRDLFLNGSLDAIIVWEPMVQDILNNPAVTRSDIFLDVDPTIYTGTINLVAKPEVLAKKRSDAVKLVQAMVCADNLIQQHPASIQQSLETWLGRSAKTLNGVFDKNTFHVGLDQPFLVNSLRTETQWAKSAVFSGKGTVPADFNRYVDTSIMIEVAADRITK